MSDQDPFDPQKFSENIRNSAKKFSDELHDQIHRDVHNGINDQMKSNARRRGPMVVGIHLGKRPFGGGVILGGILILVGLAFLLDHMGYINIDRVWRFWPLILVFSGISSLFCEERRFWGLLLIIGGIFLQLNQLGVPHFGWAEFWPVVLIAAGLMVMWNSLVSKRPGYAWKMPEGGDPRTTVNGAAVFSGLERRVTTQDFQGGSVTAVFGGIELDLTDANMQADEATLEVNAIFGGAEIRVPDSWLVAFRGAPVFGGVEDKTRLRRSAEPVDAKHKVLNITGAVVFGGLEIKN